MSLDRTSRRREDAELSKPSTGSKPPWGRHAQGLIGVAVAALLVAPAGASAGTARVSLSSAEYEALPGERNAVVFWVNDARGQSVTIRDSAGVVPGAGCSRPHPADPTVAVCRPDLSGAATKARLDAELGDGDDELTVAGPLGMHADGGPGADALTGTPASDFFHGGEGRDTIRAHGGDDRLSAGRGGGAMSGGAGEDELQGGAGPDITDGGEGTDLLSGVGANDVSRARDGTPDVVYCGRGRDRAAVDDVDFISSACEERTRGRSGAATVIEPDYRFFAPNFSEGGTNLEIGCPGDGPRRCTGTVIVKRRKTVLGRGPFSTRRDRVREADKVKPTKAGKALPTGKPVKATVILVTRDRKGRRVVRRRAGSAEDFSSWEFY